MDQQQQGWPLSSDILIDEDHNDSDPWILKHQTRTMQYMETPTMQSSTSLVPLVGTEPVSTIDDMNSLQGNTLVPNSPYLSCTSSPELTKLKQPWEEEEKTPDSKSLYETDSYQGDNDIDKRGNPLACIFVASLNNDKTDEELNISVYNHFVKWGNLINVKVFKDWMKRPYAFRTSQAKQALDESPGSVLDGRNIRCEQAKVNRTLRLSSLVSPTMHENDIQDKLSIYGQIEDIWIDKNDSTCAYVKFCYRDDAIKAFLDVRKTSILKQWVVTWCSNIKPTLTDQDTILYDKSCVYIGNLDKSIQRSQVYNRFQTYGTIRSCNIIKKPHTSINMDFAFINYTTRDAATRAIHAENGLSWYDHILRVSYRRIYKTRHDLNRHHPILPLSILSTVFPGPHPPGLGMSASDAARTSKKMVERTRYTGYHPQVTYGPLYSQSVIHPNQCTLTDAGLETYHPNPTLGPHYWYSTQGDPSSYYQMYPHAGIYYFTRVPCMESLDATYTQSGMVSTYQPMVPATKDASTNNTCDLTDDDK